MFKNYFRTAYRNLLKYKGLSAVNIGGLVIGLASALLLLGYVSFQRSYDDFHAHGKDVYRVNLSFYENNKQVFRSAENYPGLAPALKREIPEIAEAARLYNMGYKNNCVFTYNGQSFREKKFMYADGAFFRMFSFPFVKGDAGAALSQPYSAVISASLAKKIFGGRDPIGQFLKMDDDDRNAELCRVTGVFADVPANSHLSFNILISYATLDRRRAGASFFEEGWDRKDFYTYIQLRPGADASLVESKLAGVVRKYRPVETGANQKSVLSLQPLSAIHLTSGLADEPTANGNEKAMTFLTIIAFFILAIAWVNYINTTTAEAANRAKEIGVRKVMGSSKTDLVRQFLAESIAVNLFSVVLAVCLLMLVQPAIERMLEMHFAWTSIFSSATGWRFIGIILLGVFLSGLYPAFVLSAYDPIVVLKGKIRSSAAGLFLRKALVVFQFSLSIFLIIGTVIVYQQVQYMLNKDLGMNTSRVVVLERPGKWDTARRQHNGYVQHFREQLLRDPRIESVGMSDELPGKEIRNPSRYQVGTDRSGGSAQVPINTISIDDHFLTLLGFRFVAGRNFSETYKTDGRGLILTVSAARQLGFKNEQDAMGQQVESDGSSYAVVGVVNDFNQLSLEKEAAPIIFQYNNSDAREFEYYLVKTKNVGPIRRAWDDAFKDNPFDPFFLDADFNRQYQSVIRFEYLFAVFALVAIVVSCIGLFSLLAFMIRQRVKEIGIRKVLGANVRDIVVLLSRDFLRLVLLANFIAWPLGWLLMNSWLTDFAYRVPIHLVIFVLSGGMALLVAILTIGVQSAAAASANPIQNLRTE